MFCSFLKIMESWIAIPYAYLQNEELWIGEQLLFDLFYNSFGPDFNYNSRSFDKKWPINKIRDSFGIGFNTELVLARKYNPKGCVNLASTFDSDTYRNPDIGTHPRHPPPTRNCQWSPLSLPFSYHPTASRLWSRSKSLLNPWRVPFSNLDMDNEC